MFTEYLDAHDLRTSLLPPGSYHPFPPRADRTAWDALPPDARDALCAWGDEALAGYQPLTATQYLAYVRTGDRQVFEKPYFTRRRLLIGATLAECVLDDGAHLDAVIDGLWAICEESSWVISAHNDARQPMSRPQRERPLPDVDDPYWISGTLSLDDGTEVTFPLEGIDGPQEIDLGGWHRIRTLKLHRLVKCDNPSAFPSLRQIEVYGRDCGE